MQLCLSLAQNPAAKQDQTPLLLPATLTSPDPREHRCAWRYISCNELRQGSCSRKKGDWLADPMVSSWFAPPISKSESDIIALTYLSWGCQWSWAVLYPTIWHWHSNRARLRDAEVPMPEQKEGEGASGRAWIAPPSLPEISCQCQYNYFF